MVGMVSSAQDLLEGLDEAQRAAASAVDGPVRIVAVAGAGKTRTVTRRIAYACANGAWNPARTLAVTFSVKAAAEMRSRLTALDIGGGSEGGVGGQVKAATFHSAALHQLRKVWPDICDAPLPRLSSEPRDLVSRSIRRVESSDRFSDLEVRDVLAEINWAKVSLVAPSDYPRVCAATHRQPPAALEVQRFCDVYTAYEQEKTSRGEIDFNDILLIVCHILDDFEEAAATIRSSIGWLTVDEYQDISPLQHRLMTAWLNGNRNVCVVGDPAQTIYSFAGASSYDLMAFGDEFAPLAADIDLDADYRSTPPIVSCANRVLSKAANREAYLKLRPVREAGRRVVKTAYEDDRQEAQGVAAKISRMIAKGVDPGDVAILTRINAQQQMLCRALKDHGLRYRVRRETSWQDGELDEDAQARLAMLETMGLGAATHGVTISTIHAAKGLEFKHVFIVGCSEGLVPFGSPGPGDELEEERRLMYVGVTRAEDTLELSYGRRKDSMGGVMRSPSRFLV
ncbi:ATP-dependent helicase [Bifidobacterium mongoliense]|uniref:ATP-dependent helicase n=1 Tax=Bifidobacterium mongoliense TaxID=518643 RepID=UPI0026483758|nr:ATP-dependent helicase [Bifidobacterium mongoliense]MDN5633224.1 ATP-dependent helicase [Bifidobacterium mongoliense]